MEFGDLLLRYNGSVLHCRATYRDVSSLSLD